MALVDLPGDRPLDTLSALELRLMVDDLNAEYAACLDGGDIDRWPDFFTAECTYKIIARENHDRDLPLATMLCESKGYLLDRVRAVKETSMYAPRSLRHIISTARMTDRSAKHIEAEANYAVFRTLTDEDTQVFSTGRYVDELVLENRALKFHKRLCIYDTTLIPNSLVYPL